MERLNWFTKFTNINPNQDARQWQTSDLCKECQDVDFDKVLVASKGPSEPKHYSGFFELRISEDIMCPMCRFYTRLVPAEYRLHATEVTDISLEQRARDPGHLLINIMAPYPYMMDSLRKGKMKIVPIRKAESGVSRRTVTVHGHGDRYVALSYVWGPDEQGHGSGDPKSVLRDLNGKSIQISNVIQDAMAVTIGLGLQYLWVDKVCINQDDAEEKQQQLRGMDSIYNKAFLTIVAAAGNRASYGLPGVGTRSRAIRPRIRLNGTTWTAYCDSPWKTVSRSKWSHRGWTFQESFFSRRFLMFTDEQVIFECGDMLQTESRVQDLDAPTMESDINSLNIIERCDSKVHPLSLMFLIQSFTYRELTKEEDVLEAMGGLFNFHSQLEPPIETFWGLPIRRSGYGMSNLELDAYRAGNSNLKHEDIAGAILLGLQWYPYGTERLVTRREGFPSWSWSGWKTVTLRFDAQVLEVPFVKWKDYKGRGSYSEELSIGYMRNFISGDSVRFAAVRTIGSEVLSLVSDQSSTSRALVWPLFLTCSTADTEDIRKDPDTRTIECVVIGDEYGLLVQTRDGVSKRVGLMRFESDYGKYRQDDLGTLYLPRDDFCPESAYCVFCSFVARLRPAGIKGTSPDSVDFVTGEETTSERLRGWINTQPTSETPSLSSQDTGGLIIHVTSGVNEFQTVNWRVERTYYNPPKDGPDRDIVGTFRLWKYQAPDCYLPTPTVDTLTYITKYAKQWLRLCDESHEVCKSLASNSTPPISLIDCNQRCLVHSSQGIRYVALSYVWGKTGRNFNLPKRRYGVPLDGLPRTITDAITVTKSLGYDYLWVDMLCIDQQSEEDKLRQIAIMDQIYRSADLTIIVAAGSDCGDGIPGVSERCRPPRMSIKIGNTVLVEDKENAVTEIRYSTWRSRGWTFQEGLLSRRRLVFTDTQLLFSCLSSQATEPEEGPEFSHKAKEAPIYMRQKEDLWDTSFLQTDSVPRTYLIENQWFHGTTVIKNDRFHSRYGFPIAFAELLEEYSKLNFSFESDIVNAFRAIGNTFALRSPPVLHLYGLPFIFDAESITASSITRALAWCLVRGDEETARRSGFPSWSWLGYRGPVRWGAFVRNVPPGPIDAQWSAKTFSHVLSITTISNRSFELLQLSQWWQEWSSARASEGLAPSRLMLSGPMIKQELWLDSKSMLKPGWGDSGPHVILDKEACLSNFQYNIGGNLHMSADACRCLFDNLRSGSWRALVLTQSFLLLVQSVSVDVKGGLYRRVAGVEIEVSHTTEEFVETSTNVVEVELV
ncbi:uncharacterized protein FIESC28_05839 [Fusarium coffeatum]|uniref:Heterokaryon incompatibility domain-containing protein n=1 Tax=Fusarium coffeatum TaxID=231269 RepID=A0A366RP78_9HYPO|nr:uncharacterized protein FIESC28_05839 [Fusarium coffeatum]RBR18917.1 hypothetical protein FIESC28_05839 [Fusarium coffeatum]